jgi:exodeoxyribonuclease V gamma subunit
LPSHRVAPWDGDSRTQDRQWLLDALLAPSDRLILTAANRSLRTAHDGPLSACVEDVLRAAADTVRAPAGAPAVREQLVIKHRIQPFAREYFTGPTVLPLSFDAAAARIAGELAAAPAAPHPFRPAPTSTAAAAGEVTLAELVAFWRDPARAWLRALQLEVAGEEDDDTELDDAPLTLDALQAYHVENEALEARIGRKGVVAAVESSRLSADRGLPPGALGQLQWEVHDEKIRALATGLAGVLPGRKSRPVDVVLPAGGGRIVGEVTLVTGPEGGDRVLVYRGGKIAGKVKYQLAAFVQTLAAEAAGVANGAQVFGLDLPQGKPLDSFSVPRAMELLTALVAGYRAGQHRPLAFAPETSEALAEALAEEVDPEVALDAAREAWNNPGYGDQPAGEGAEPAAALAWRDADPFEGAEAEEWHRWARDVAAPLRAWWKSAAVKPSPKAKGAARPTA